MQLCLICPEQPGPVVPQWEQFNPAEQQAVMVAVKRMIARAVPTDERRKSNEKPSDFRLDTCERDLSESAARERNHIINHCLEHKSSEPNQEGRHV